MVIEGEYEVQEDRCLTYVSCWVDKIARAGFTRARVRLRARDHKRVFACWGRVKWCHIGVARNAAPLPPVETRYRRVASLLLV